MLVVAALGGNALIRRGESPDAESQRQNVRRAALALVDIARNHHLVITHGNGPQIGLLALQSAAMSDAAPTPLDLLGAETEGMIGYMIEQELANFLPGREIATLLTRVEVELGDVAFEHPTKPIGACYSEAEARRMAAARGWAVARDGAYFRRVVPSPEPQRILEQRTIELLLAAGTIVVCAGGGGIPVAIGPGGGMRGVEAVIDKDLSAALLAAALRADLLLLLTDVPGVFVNWPDPASDVIRRTTSSELRRLSFAAGSMAPKVEAACRFVEKTGGRAMIGALEDADRLLRDSSGTSVLPNCR